jgi:hypothetical protein
VRWQAVTGDRLEAQLADVTSAGDVELQRLYDAPRGDFRIIEAYLRALRSAQQLVYLENQFLWSPEIVNILADKLRRPPADGFRVVVVLPGRANSGQDDTRGQLALPDGGTGASCPRRSGGARATRATVCTCTRRSGSSTIGGSRSARRTSTRTRSSTTARSTS